MLRSWSQSIEIYIVPNIIQVGHQFNHVFRLYRYPIISFFAERLTSNLCNLDCVSHSKFELVFSISEGIYFAITINVQWPGLLYIKICTLFFIFSVEEWVANEKTDRLMLSYYRRLYLYPQYQRRHYCVAGFRGIRRGGGCVKRGVGKQASGILTLSVKQSTGAASQ